MSGNGNIRVVISGASGRMGQALLHLIKLGIEPKISLAAAIDKGDRLSELKGKVDLLIDFSRPEATLAYLGDALQLKLPIVIGTTGFNSIGKEQIDQAATKLPIVFSPNMSPGMNVMMHYVGSITKSLGEEFDLDITELHHRNKQDAPSGSALKLGEQIKKTTGREPRYQSLRTGGVVGEHRVLCTADFELIELKHVAMNRDVFARGALLAARWLHGKKPGLYSMQDVLGL